MISKLREDANSLSQIVSALSSQLNEHRLVTQKMEKEQLRWPNMYSSVKEANRVYRSCLERMEASLAQVTKMQMVGINRRGNIVAQNMTTMLAPRLEKFIASEFKKAVAPAISKLVDSTKFEVNLKAGTTEMVMRNVINNGIRSKAMVDTLAKAIDPLLRSESHNVCREILQNNFMRGLDNVCQDMSSELAKTFRKGVHEILEQVQQYIENSGQDHAKKAVKNIESNLDTCLQTFLRHHKATLVTPDMRAELDEAVKKGVHVLKSGVLQALAAQQKMLVDNLKQEIYGALKETVGEAASGGMESHSNVNTPVPVDPHLVLQQITLLVHQGQYNMAFQQALSVADPAALVSTCEMVCPAIAIGQDPCPLEQPVLLSLIEQLCADLATRTAVKLRYLEEAVLSLDEENTVEQEHKKAVLMWLYQKIKELLKQNPPHDMERMAKRLIMVTQSSLNC